MGFSIEVLRAIFFYGAYSDGICIALDLCPIAVLADVRMTRACRPLS